MVNTAILKKSMSEAGCIAPFMPRNISKDYPICESFETGTLAWDIYNKYVYEAQFSPDSEVGTLTGSPLSAIVCSVAEALQCDDGDSGHEKCCWQVLPLQSHH